MSDKNAESVAPIISRELFRMRSKVGRMQDCLEEADRLLDQCFGDGDQEKVAQRLRRIRALVFRAERGAPIDGLGGAE